MFAIHFVDSILNIQFRRTKLCLNYIPRRSYLVNLSSTNSEYIRLNGRCSFVPDESLPRTFPLSPSIKLKGASSQELRTCFLEYFRNNGHRIVAPASLLPKANEGSYFINAGMNQFKSLFLNRSETRSMTTDFGQLRRATNSQSCIRMGGRMNDLNEVGFDRSHHTMFEMLGNWSFGDYYKEDACRFVWQFLTQELGLPSNALYVTYFGGDETMGLDPDLETRDIWLKLGISDQKLIPFGLDANFWRTNDFDVGGLGGPSTEVHVDFEALSSPTNLQCARCLVNSPTSGRVVELWNCVFIEYRFGCRESGQLLQPLRRGLVDTGMGLERLSSIMQGVTSNYDTDLFANLMDKICTEASKLQDKPVPSYEGLFLTNVHDRDRADVDKGVDETSRAWNPINWLGHKMNSTDQRLNTNQRPPLDLDTIETWHRDVAYRLVADHSRALAQSMYDGILPSRSGLGQKLRLLIHRATRAALLTGLEVAFDCQQPPSASILGSLVTYQIGTHIEQLNRFYAQTNAVKGPNYRKSTEWPLQHFASIIDEQVAMFKSRFVKLENSFNSCLDQNPNLTQLTDSHVLGLMNGSYGAQVPWEMIVSQCQWFGLPPPRLPSDLDQQDDKKWTFPSPSSPPSPLPVTTCDPSMLKSACDKLQLSSLDYTNDDLKYNYRRQLSGNGTPRYRIPTCKAKLVGLVVPDDRDCQIVNRDQFQSTTVDNSLPSFVGLIFDRTNFCSRNEEHDCDIGTISIDLGRPLFKIKEVSTISDSSADGSLGWCIHWCQLASSCVQQPKDILNFDNDYILEVDEDNRIKLMRAHTGRHLFAAVLESSFVQTLTASSVRVANSHVHPDAFVVRAAFVGRAASELGSGPLGLVEKLQVECRTLMMQNASVVSFESNWNAVLNSNRIKYSPSRNYSDHVRVVCIGSSDEPKSVDGDNSCITAQLCDGTHVHQLGDVKDLVITSIRDRNQSLKEFTCAVGDLAVELNDNAKQLFANFNQLQSTKRIDRVKWLQPIMDDPNFINQYPLQTRLQLVKIMGQLKSSKLALVDNDGDERKTALQLLIQQDKDSDSSWISVCTDFSPLDSFVGIIESMKICKPCIFIGPKNYALLFFPNLDVDQRALHKVHRIAEQLNSYLSDEKHELYQHVCLKARPVRLYSPSAMQDPNFSYKFAQLQITHFKNNLSSDVTTFRFLFGNLPASSLKHLLNQLDI